jgi:hypothetical protein
VAPNPTTPSDTSNTRLTGSARQKNIEKAERSAGQVRAEYSWLITLVESDDTGSLRGLLDWVEGQYKRNVERARQGKVVPDVPFTQDQFDRRFNATEWRKRYTSYEAERRREAADPDLKRDFEFRKETQRNRILSIAEEYGIVLSDEDLDLLVDTATFQGWDETRIRRGLAPALEQSIAGEGELMGVAGDVENDLLNWARRNGLNLSRQAAAKYIANITTRKQSLDDAKNDIRRTYMAGMFPGWADKINEGFDPSDLFEPYRDSALRLLELSDIGFDDPIMKRATQSIGPDGKPMQMPLYQFEEEIRKDPRWQYTDNAYESYSNVGTQLLRMFGFR